MKKLFSRSSSLPIGLAIGLLVNLLITFAGAAVIAILALAYGLYNDWRFGTLGEQSAPMIDNRDIYDVVPESAEEGVRNPDLDYITPKE